MESICDLKVEAITESSWIRLVQVKFTQDMIKKKQDITHSHNSCGILIHNISRNVFVFVRQFRPAVFMYEAGWDSIPINGNECVNVSKDKLQRGFTIELCAGIIDKEDKTVEDIAVLEVLEECGYKVDVKDLEPILATRNNSYHSGTLQSMFYVQVTDNMKVDGWGGGNEEEGEFIQIVEVKVEEVLKSVFDDQLPKPVGWTFAIVWFCYTKVSLSISSSLFPSLKYHFETLSYLNESRKVITEGSKNSANNGKDSGNFKKRSLSPEEHYVAKKIKNGKGIYDDVIKDITVINIKKSDELQLYRLHYSQNKRKKAWDFFLVKSTCATLVHNVSRNVFVLVRKFSPAVYASIYLNDLKSSETARNGLKASPACLNQLCSTFYSNDPCVAASENIFRTLGYRVCSREFQKILHCRSNVGTAGALLTLLYVKVTDEMKVKPSSNVLDKSTAPKSPPSSPECGKDILDVIEVPVVKGKQGNTQCTDGLTMAMTNKENPLSLSLALLWFYLQNHSKPQ